MDGSMDHKIHILPVSFYGRLFDMATFFTQMKCPRCGANNCFCKQEHELEEWDREYRERGYEIPIRSPND
jgi:hypothetical protein